jgi:hypothetical protein
MAQFVRTRLLRKPKHEQEIRMISNPSNFKDDSANAPLVPRGTETTKIERQHRQHFTSIDDYEAPLTAHSLRPNSYWIIVRRNLHRIRFMGYNERERDCNTPDIYLGLQMKRELKRAQEEIKNIDKEANFCAIKHFALAVDNKRIKTYDTSHVQPNDALIYDRLGEEPLALQNLLYYFSKQDVSHGTLFWDFLNEVNRVLHMNRKRTLLVQRLRRLALTLAVIFYVIVGIMLFLLIISVVTTVTKMNDPEVRWMEPDADNHATFVISPSS